MSYTRKIIKLHLTAENPGSYEHYVAELMLPAEEYEIRDAMHKLRAVGREDNVCICVLECSELPKFEELEEGDLEYISIDELNFFAKRLVAMTHEERIVFDAVSRFMLSNNLIDVFKDMKELINCTYGLDSVMIASNIYNDEQLGQFVIDGDLFDEINELPDKAIPLLDRKKVGEQFRMTYGCEYVDGVAVFAGDYESPEIYDGKTLPDSDEADPFVFRLKVGEYPTGGTTETEDDAEWISLPTNIGIARDMAIKHHEPSVESCVCYEFESSIPQIDSEIFRGMLNFDKLNNLAWKYSLLSPAEQIKCKAAFEAEQPKDIAGALNIVKNLNQYEFSALSQNYDQFFREYLLHHLNASFDNEWLDTIAVNREGEELLEKLKASLTEYGVISARGRSLYELVPRRDPEVKELIAQVLTDEKLDVIELLDRQALFSNGRLSPEEIPEGLYAYDLRFDDEQNRFVSIEPKVGANHGGTVLMKELLDFGESGVIFFTEDSSPNFLSEEMTIKEFSETDMDEDKEIQIRGMQL